MKNELQIVDNLFLSMLREATQSVEQELLAEDEGWIRFGATSDFIDSNTRISNLKKSRWYFMNDPLARQAIRLWTDYCFGSGMTWQTTEDNIQEVMANYWDAKVNQPLLSARGQRKSSDKLLVDGEVFFAIFLGSDSVAIRRIDPLEITEIITDPDDYESVKFYKREWNNQQGVAKTSYYRSTANQKGEKALDSMGKMVSHTEDALVYHMAFNTIGQRGNPLLLPALEWIKQYRRFLASRVAIMLALARFAWKTKIKGGQTAVNAQKGKAHDELPAAGSWMFENLGSDTQSIKTDSGARNAYEDGRQLKLMVASAVGIPEQYFGDISIGNLATAKTVELPMMKMFQSYQKVWADSYQDIDEIVLEHAGIPKEKWNIDRDFPDIAPEDSFALAQAMTQIIQNMPEFAYSRDVQQRALMALGINNTEDVLDDMAKSEESNPDIKLSRALRQFRESLSNNGHKE